VDLDPVVGDGGPMQAGMWDEASVRKAWAKLERDHSRAERDWNRFYKVAWIAAAVVLLGLLSPLSASGLYAWLSNERAAPEFVYEPVQGIAAPPEYAPRASHAVPATGAPARLLTHDYAWDYGGKHWTWTLQIDARVYEEFKDRNRSAYSNEYSVFVIDRADDAILESLATRLRAAAEREGYSDTQLVAFTLAFVQSLPYASDDVTSPFDEYPRYPVETLIDDGSDCEDTAILFASLMLTMGVGAVLLSPPGHMGVGVDVPSKGTRVEYEGRQYAYVETTGAGWTVGEVPEHYAGQSMKVYALEGRALLATPSWSAPWIGEGYQVAMSVQNVGSDDAHDVTLYAALDAGEGLVWDQASCAVAVLRPGQQSTCTVLLKAPPRGEESRLIVRASAANAASKESYSQRFTA
jgi:hypothetical protein